LRSSPTKRRFAGSLRKVGLVSPGDGTPDAARAFGDVSGVPTLLLFDRTGKSSAAFAGAPPDLHSRAETKLAGVVPPPAVR
jgi:hypothetical protein